MKTLVKLVVPFAVLVSAPAFADQALATKSCCMACHAAEKKVVGPAFQEIAKKYAGDAGAAAKLAEKIKTGGKGNWGPVPMPPNPQVNDAARLKLANWVLKGGK